MTQLGATTNYCETWEVPRYEYVSRIEVVSREAGSREVVGLAGIRVTLSDGT